MSKKHDVLELNIDLKEMSNRLKTLRESKGLTQPKLGELIGYDKATVSSCENGHTLPKSEVLIRLSDYYDVSIDYLLGRSEYTRKEIEDIGKPLGLSEKSIVALLVLNTSDHAIVNKYFKDYRECLIESDLVNFSRNLKVVNLILEMLFDDLTFIKKCDYDVPLDNVLVPLYDYIYSDRLEKEDENLFTVRDYIPDKQEVILFDSFDTLQGGYVSELYRKLLIDRIIQRLEKLRENENKEIKGGGKNGKHTSKR